MLGLLAAASCGPQRGGSDPNAAPEPGLTPATWPYAPATMRVHPLSRIMVPARAEEATRAEVHVQCLDLEGDSTRSIGLLRVQVGDPASAASVQHDLGDPAVNRADWDPVTRTYRFTLPVPEGFRCAPGTTLPVQVQLQLSPTRALQAQGTVACP
jgi:hypothetical protein